MPGEAGVMPASSINICCGVFRKFILSGWLFLFILMHKSRGIRPTGRRGWQIACLGRRPRNYSL